jgi:CDP-diacylglycerol--glycerol-3-phosphate 3-phosphatidyltransferase
MKSIANYITVSRIFLTFSLFGLEPLGASFLIVYAICGITDMLDGYIARKTGTTSAIGGKLDSIADLVMVIVVIYILYPIIILPEIFYYWILGIILIRGASLIIVFTKFHTFGILHSYSNKATGLTLFTVPLLLAFFSVESIACLLIVLGILSALEEMIIHSVSDTLDINRKSLVFYKKTEG